MTKSKAIQKYNLLDFTLHLFQGKQGDHLLF